MSSLRFAAPLRQWEDRLDWLENQRAPAGLGVWLGTAAVVACLAAAIVSLARRGN
jgi:hypothetical protein